MRFNLIIVSFLLFSCKSSTIKICNYEENIIKEEEIFNFKNNYYVFIYLDSCMACRDTKLRLMEYCKKETNNIYYLDLLETNFYKNETLESNINVNNYHNIYIHSVPHLLLIKQKKVVAEWNGFSSINDLICNK